MKQKNNDTTSYKEIYTYKEKEFLLGAKEVVLCGILTRCDDVYNEFIVDGTDIIGMFQGCEHVTDFAILTGYKQHKDDDYFDNPTCNKIEFIDTKGNHIFLDPCDRTHGFYPLIKYHFIEDMSRDYRGEIEFGEYPQKVVSLKLSCDLERIYSRGGLKETGKIYTIDSVDVNDKNTHFKARQYVEYEYNGKKYIRFIGDSNCEGEILSDGRKVKKGEVYWIEVKPIIWLIVSTHTGEYAVTKNIMFAGVQMSLSPFLFNFFENLTILEYFNTFFIKDIIPSKINNKLIETRNSVQLQEQTSEMILLENIEFLLQKLKILDEKLYKKYKAQYEEMINSEDKILTLYPLTKEAALQLMITIEQALEKNTNKIIKTKLIELKEKYILSLIDNKKTNYTLQQIDDITKKFLEEKDKYSLLDQRTILKDISLIYLFEVMENIDDMTKEILEKSYFKLCLNYILISLNSLIEENIIKTDLQVDFNNEITLEYVFELLKNIRFKKKKIKQI